MIPYDLIVIPFHDWHKVQREGRRTRDAHLINAFLRDERVGKLFVVNRPVSVSEMAIRGKGWKTTGDLVESGLAFQVVRLTPKLYVIDSRSSDLVKPFILKKRWFFQAYGDAQFSKIINKFLGTHASRNLKCICFNVFAADLFQNLSAQEKLFDAYDNLLKFPMYKSIQANLEKAYRTCSNATLQWSTNSKANVEYYRDRFNVKSCIVIPNGVEIDRFRGPYPLPPDLASIPRPRVGTAAKITHLINVELLNRVISQHPLASFVLIGQILDKSIYRRIVKRKNFYYLGDKHYDRYPAYLTHFDVCMIPYIPWDKQHGGDPMKYYEYLASGKPIVTTRMPVTSETHGNVYVSDSPDAFSVLLDKALKQQTVDRRLDPTMDWSHLGERMLNALSGGREETC